MHDNPLLLQFEGLTKRFGGVAALTDVTFSIQQGDNKRGVIHGLVGENGAGKSTLIKCLVGVHAPDAGRIVWEGRSVAVPNVQAARTLGIDIVFQEIELAPNLTVAESLFLGREPRGPLGLVNYGAMRHAAQTLLDDLGIPLPPDTPIALLRTAEKQSVQIARALASGNARLLILDEPTSALSDHEVVRLLARLEALRERGTSLLYVSHKLDEVLRFCDDITVLRDGRHVVTRPRAGLTTHDLVALMVGRDGPHPPAPSPKIGRGVAGGRGEGGPSEGGSGEVRLSVRHLTREPAFRDVAFDVYVGEVLGVFGIVGAGRTEVARALFGLDHVDAGTVSLDNRLVRFGSPSDAIAAGIALVPEDRKEQGLLLDDSLRRNTALPNLDRIADGGIVRGQKEWRLAVDAVQQLNIAGGREQAVRAAVQGLVGGLSGGNQQKVVLAKWLARNPTLLLLDEPTKGIDVSAKAEVYRVVRGLAAMGVSVLLISSELDEILQVADRVLVMRGGRVAATLPAANATREAILRHAVVGDSELA